MIVKSKEMEENKFINLGLFCFKKNIWLYEQSDKSQLFL